MVDESRLHDIFEAWETARAEGRDPDLLDLCRGDPALVSALRHRIAVFEAIDVARRLTSDDVLERLAWLMATRGVPDHIRSDNGPESAAKVVRAWLGKVGVKTLFIEPGSPSENGYVESFNGKPPDELLNGEVVCTRREARMLIERWRGPFTPPARTRPWATKPPPQKRPLQDRPPLRAILQQDTYTFQLIENVEGVRRRPEVSLVVRSFTQQIDEPDHVISIECVVERW